MNLLAIVFLALFAQQSGSTSVQGTVVQMGNSQPVARAIVELKGESERNSYVKVSERGRESVDVTAGPPSF